MCDIVTGTSIDDWFGEASTVKVPNNLSAATVEALVPMGGGQWKTIAGKGKEDGTFAIQGVPSGPYVLHTVVGTEAPSYVYTSAREIDLGIEKSGRKDAVAPTIKPTTLITDITGVDAWKDGDDIEWFVPNNNAWVSLSALNPAAENPPAEGATALTALSFDWGMVFGPAFITKSKGDHLTVLQLSKKTGAGNVSYKVATRFTSFNDLTQIDGSPLNVNGAFTAIPEDQSASFDLRPTEFTTLIPAVNPKATDFGFNVLIVTMAGAGQVGTAGNSADLLTVELGKGSADVDLGSVKYGNPFPAAFGAVAFAGNTVRMSYTMPGATTPLHRSGFVQSVGDPKAVLKGPVKPAMSPARELKLNGLSAFSDQAGVTTTPTVTWTAPSIGVPALYVVHIEKLTNNGGKTQATVVANLFTKDTKVELPPGVLSEGGAYFMRLTAHDLPLDPEAHPLRSRGIGARADTFSNVFSP